MSEKQTVSDYYGKRLNNSDDLNKTSVTQCSRKTDKVPKFIIEALGLIHEEITSRTYGCATAYPEALEGATVLDLGSGCGRDCFVLSKVVGEKGAVVGLDMTDDLLKIATDKIAYHTETFGYSQPNVRFVKGVMENMKDSGLQDNFFDVIVSNCVISLCRDKKAVLKEASRVLKPGGELYFSDMYREGKLPEDVLNDETMWCEGLIGSLTYKELHNIAYELGFTVPRLVQTADLPVLDEGIKKRLGDVRYASATYRLFKKPNVEQPHTSAVTYKGGIQGYEQMLTFDTNYTFKVGEKILVDGELATVLMASRFSSFFNVDSTEENATLPSLDVDPFQLIRAKACCK